ncbi:MAG: hypothetical protein ABSA83_12425 [Verrucomicrobiota bacterium]
MPKIRSKDPLLAATTSILLPAVKPFGFQRHGSRKLIRIREDILHLINPWYSGWGGRDFHVDCWAMPLVPATSFIYSARGDRVCDEVSQGSLWAGQTQELADTSMERVVKIIQKRVLPFFISIETTESFLNLLKQRPDPDHHEHFRVACCLVRLTRLDEARERLIAAIRAYAEDGRAWCAGYATQCEQMVKAIDEGTALELLENWKMETIRNLKLQKIVSNGTGA